MKKEYLNFLRENGLKNTEQRELVFETIMHSRSHLTIEDVVERVKKKYPRIGYVTVYRMLKQMHDCDLVVEHNFDGKSRYESNFDRAHHDHLICNKCGKIIEFQSPAIEKLQDQIASQYKFKVVDHKHELYGLCDKCQLA